jgi:N-acetylmuramoyl-L-alanine amidase
VRSLFKTLLLPVVLIVTVTPPCFGQATAPLPGAAKSSIVRLLEQGYWCDTSLSERSAINKQAIVAFQKLHSIKRSGQLTAQTRAQDSLGVRHYEVNLQKQVLLMVDSSNRVYRILTVSTGNGKWFETELNGGRYALTPRGRFQVFYKVSGWRKSELGELYYPMYIRGGVAIHGAPSVPALPASHGCIRIPMFAARELAEATPIGTPVIVYGDNPKPTGKPN